MESFIFGEHQYIFLLSKRQHGAGGKLWTEIQEQSLPLTNWKNTHEILNLFSIFCLYFKDNTFLAILQNSLRIKWGIIQNTLGTIEHHIRVKNYPSVLPDSKWPNMKVLKPEIFLIKPIVKKKKKKKKKIVKHNSIKSPQIDF